MKADPFRQSAIIAYYAIFSIPALLVIVITCAGWFFGEDAVRGEISSQIAGSIGKDTAEQLEDVIAKVGETKDSIIAAIISVITLIVGSTSVFAELQVSLNQIWEVKVVSEKKLLKSMKDRLFSFGLVLSIAFLLLISLVVSAVLASFTEYLKTQFPDGIVVLMQFADFLVSFAIISFLFALMFKILPDAIIRWKDVWLGAMVTSLLFAIGKILLGLYFGKAEPASAYGAAGSIVLIMLWVSYSCMILFYGAEFTKQYASAMGKGIRPKKDAILIEPKEEDNLIREKRKAVRRAS